MDVAAERAYLTPLSNSTLLPMLLLSLVQQKHSPDTSRTIQTEYDFVIVGAGSAGSVVASRLSEVPCVSVLLLEAGKPPPILTDVPSLARYFWFTDISWQYRTAPQRYAADAMTDRQIPWPSGKTFGGSSTINGNIFVRGNRKDYDRWVDVGADGWSYEEVLPYFKKMEDNRDPEYVYNGFHGIGGPVTVHRQRYEAEFKDPLFRTVDALGYKVVDPNGPKQTGFYDLQGTLRSGQRCSTAKAYLVPAENRTNLDILPNAMVRKVIIDKRKAVGVEFDFQGVTYVVKARKEVIMSAGTINTAQLLMLSGIGPRQELQRLNIPVIADLPVGRNLQDQIGTFLNFQITPSVPRVTDKMENPANVMQYIQNRTGPLGTDEFIQAIALLNNKVVAPKNDFPDYQLYFAEAQNEVFSVIGIRPEVFAQYFGPLEGQAYYTCVSSLLHPKSRGTVTLNSTDPYDPPVIDPNYFSDPDDIRAITDGLKTCMRIGNHPIMQELMGSTLYDVPLPGCEQYAGNEDWYFRCLARSLLLGFYHPVGTATMGNLNNPRTVVDPQLRILNIKGLRVVDASVMPLIPSGNTNVPTIMVAEKASDIIKSTLECFNHYDDKWNKQESDRQEDSQVPNSDYYDYGPERKKKKSSFWSNTRPQMANPGQYQTPLKIKHQQTDIDQWVKEPISSIAWNQGNHVGPWNQEILSSDRKFTAGGNVMDNSGNQNILISDDQEENQDGFLYNSPPPFKKNNQQQQSQLITVRPQIENTPTFSNTQNTRPQAPLIKPQTQSNQPQMQMTTTPMPSTSSSTQPSSTTENSRPSTRPGRGKNITMIVQKPRGKIITMIVQKPMSKIPVLANQIRNKMQEILEQLLILKPSNAPPNSMQLNIGPNQTISNGPSNPMQSNISSNQTQSNRPSTAMQSNRPSTAMQSNRPSITVQSNRPSITMQSNRPSITMQSNRPSITMQSNRPSITMQSNRPNNMQSNIPNSMQSNRPNSMQSNRPNDMQSNTPNTMQSNRPNSMQSNRPNSMQSNRPNSMQSNRPNNMQSNIPNSMQSNIPNSMQSNRPNSMQSNRPNAMQSNTPNTMQSNRPNSMQSNRPNNMQSNIPNSMQSNIPNSMQSNRPNSMQSNRPNSMQSNRPNSMQSNRPNSMQSNTPNAMQSNTPNTMQSNRPNTMQSNRPNTMQSNRPSTTVQTNIPLSGSNMRPDILEQIKKLKQMASYDEKFCNSLLKFNECQQQACLQSAQFALYMYNILCSSPKSTT